jgi:hypothetical protein
VAINLNYFLSFSVLNGFSLCRKAETVASGSNSKQQKACQVGDQLDAGARKIQKYWKQKFRFRTTFKLVEEFFSKGPTIEHVKSIRFSHAHCRLYSALIDFGGLF